MKVMIAVAVSAITGVLVGSVVSHAGSPPGTDQQAQLAGRSVLAGTTGRDGGLQVFDEEPHASAAEPAAWWLSSTTDVEGRQVKYTRTQAATGPDTASYPATISDGGVRVTFYYQNRSDLVTYGDGRSIVAMHRRLRAVDVSLESLKFGKRPRIRMAYTVASPNLLHAPSNLGDVDGIGRTDWVQTSPDLVLGPNAHHTNILLTAALAGGTAPVYTQTTVAMPFPGLIKTTYLTDVDADGRADLVLFPLLSHFVSGTNPTPTCAKCREL